MLTSIKAFLASFGKKKEVSKDAHDWLKEPLQSDLKGVINAELVRLKSEGRKR